MTCPNNENLVRFTDRELTDADEASIRQHLIDCAECRKEMHNIKVIDSATAHLMDQKDIFHQAESKCLDPVILSQYLSGRVTLKERESLEAHLSQCQLCLDELLVAEDMLEMSRGNAKRTPAHLLAKAVGLGEKKPRATSKWPPFKLQLNDWWRFPMTIPRWCVASAGACVVAVLAVFLSLQLHNDRMDSLIAERNYSTRPIENPDSQIPASFGKPIRDLKIDFTPDIKVALKEYVQSKDTDSLNKFFALIKSQAPDISLKTEQVIIHENLLTAILVVEDVAGRIRIRSYKNGTLVISGDAN
jgi:hypothetical protein